MWILEHVAGASGYTLVAYAAGAAVTGYVIVKIANAYLYPDNRSHYSRRAVGQHQHSNNYFDLIVDWLRSCLPTWLGGQSVPIPQLAQIPNPALLRAAKNQHREDEAEKEALRKRVKELDAAEANANVSAVKSMPTVSPASTKVAEPKAVADRIAELDFAKQCTQVLRSECSDKEAIDKIGSLLIENSHVKNLDLVTTLLRIHRNDGTHPIRRIGPVLQSNRTLTSIDLDSNSISPEGVVAIAEAVKTNRTLRLINLRQNNIGLRGAIAIAEALKINDALTSINLSEGQISFEGLTAIAEALKINRSLTQIKLNVNHFGEGCATALAEALKINRSLTQIELNRNEFGAGGATALAEALKMNRSLTQIKLDGNEFGAGGAIAIAEALKTNRTLTEMFLIYNAIGPEGAAAIAAALKTNRTLTSIWLSANKIGKTGVANLIVALEQNPALTQLGLDDEGQYQAQPYLERNRKLKQQGCVAILSLRKYQRGFWGTAPKDILEMMLRMAYPDILRGKRLNFPSRSAPTKVEEEYCSLGL